MRMRKKISKQSEIGKVRLRRRRRKSDIYFKLDFKFFLLVLPCIHAFPGKKLRRRAPSKHSSPPRMACARAYKLSASGYRGNKRVLSRGEHCSEAPLSLSLSPWSRVSIDAVRFYQSCRDHDHERRHQIILFIERKRSLNRRARYVVYLLCSASSYFSPLYPSPAQLLQHVRFSLLVFFSLPATDSRPRFSVVRVDKMPGKRATDCLASTRKGYVDREGGGGEEEGGKEGRDVTE